MPRPRARNVRADNTKCKTSVRNYCKREENRVHEEETRQFSQVHLCQRRQQPPKGKWAITENTETYQQPTQGHSHRRSNNDDRECFSFVKWTKMAKMKPTGAHVHDRQSAAAAAAVSMTEANLHVCTSTDLPHNLEHTHFHFWKNQPHTECRAVHICKEKGITVIRLTS